MSTCNCIGPIGSCPCIKREQEVVSLKEGEIAALKDELRFLRDCYNELWGKHKIQCLKEIGKMKDNILNEKPVELKKSGKYLTSLCPFHEERTASFVVDEKRAIYYCFGCGAKGNTEDLNYIINT